MIAWATASPIHCSSRGRSGVAKGKISTLRTLVAAAACVWAHAGVAMKTSRQAIQSQARRVTAARAREIPLFDTRLLNRFTSGPSLGVTQGAYPRHHATESTGADAPQRDLGDQQDGRQSDQPRPEVDP